MRFRSGIILALAGLLLTACATRDTQLTSVSLDESARGSAHEHLFVLAVTEKNETRRAVETALAEVLSEHGIETTVSHSVASELALEDRQALREQVRGLVKKTPATAVLATMLIKADVRAEYVPAFGQGFMIGRTSPEGDSTERYFDLTGTGGYFTSRSEYRVRTSLFDVASRREVWRAKSVTRDPGERDRSIRDFAELIVERLDEDRMLGS
jgi:hypothetical protein